MASVFRRRIANQIISILNPCLKGKERSFLHDTLPLALKLHQPKLLSPQLELSWKDVLKLRPELQETVHPKTVMTYLKNQDFPTQDGIKEVSMDAVNADKFIFTLEQEVFTSSVLLDICANIDRVPNNSCFFKNIPPENVVIEFSSPNIAKPFHFGHFRSTVIGNFMANLCKYVGHDVMKINYLGDWGLQYGILATGYNKFGSEEKLLAGPLSHLYEVYKAANSLNTNNPEFHLEAKSYFKKMEEGDEEALSQWKKLKDLSLKQMDETYERLNICFDETHGESMYSTNVHQVYEELLHKKIANVNEDTSIEANFLSEDGEKSEKAVLRKNDGTSLYLARDLAAAVDRKKRFHFDTMYYVVDSSQGKHFSHLKSLLKAMGYSWSSNVHHIHFGHVLNFSTRKGTAVFLDNILDEAKERTLERMNTSQTTKVSDSEEVKRTAEALGVAALIINDFRTRRKRDTPFDWDRVLSMKADSGVSLQYCHARLNNIKENCGVELNVECDLSSLVEPEALALIHIIAKFDEALYQTYVDMEPCVLVHYLFLLKNEVGRAIRVLTVKGSNPYVARSRLLLFHAAYLVLHKCLLLFGVTPLNKM